MKKSEMFYKAQLAVLRDTFLSDSEKLEILAELEDKKGVALYLEREEVQAAHKEKEAE